MKKKGGKELERESYLISDSTLASSSASLCDHSDPPPPDFRAARPSSASTSKDWNPPLPSPAPASEVRWTLRLSRGDPTRSPSAAGWALSWCRVQFEDLWFRVPLRTMPTETNVESGTFQSKGGTSINLSMRRKSEGIRFCSALEALLVKGVGSI